jgi:hypothetical protein
VVLSSETFSWEGEVGKLSEIFADLKCCVSGYTDAAKLLREQRITSN